MKTKLTIAALFAITAVFFLTCDNPVGLGAMLDLEGPLVEFTSPAPRQALLAEFDITGVVSDKTGVDRMLLTAERTIAVENDDETTYETVTYAKQWRYENGKWEVSANSGANWGTLSGARAADAAGPTPGRTVTNAAWSVPIDMKISGSADDGIYLFKIQAWDSGGFTGDSSTKTIVLIVDQFPPKVSVIDPYIFSRVSFTPPSTFTDPDLKGLHDIAANDKIKSRTSSNMGLFMTRGFDLKWQIDDEYDIGSIDIIFCEYDTPVDGIPETPINNTKIYYTYHEDLPKPNGLTSVPNLTAAKGKHDGKDGEIINPILTTEKKTIKVVGVCKDVAGNPSNDEEKILGYFVYWPMADEPWIEFPEKMDNPYSPNPPDSVPDGKDYFNKDVKTLVEPYVLMAYPGRSIKPAAYQAHGISKVRYALYQCEEEKTGNIIKLTGKLNLLNNYKSVNKPREINDNKIFSTNFTWEIVAPDRPGYYVVKAIPYDLDSYNVNDKDGRDEEPFADIDNPAIEKFTALFRVQDISFPEFLPGYPLPSATEPLFKFIGNPEADGEPDDVPDGKIRISGKVDDAVGLDSLLMVWINPASRNYSAMSQLEYFRDPGYMGWTQAEALAAPADATDTSTGVETAVPNVTGYPYDANNPNRLWKLYLPPSVEDEDTYRKVYTYSQIIDLIQHLKIGFGPDPANPSKQLNPLKSQMFLLRAKNGDGKATIITYAPQGDALGPTIKISSVQVGSDVFTSGQGFTQIPQFTDAGGQVITIRGTWEEDSTKYLDNETYFYNNMRFSINGLVFDRLGRMYDKIDSDAPSVPAATAAGIAINITQTAETDTVTKGSFVITATVATPSGTNQNNTLKPSNLRDTLALNAFVRDYGGNPAEDGASWLIQSDKLRFLRISSDKEDSAYRVGEQIRIFIEFNKPVVLKKTPARSRNPVLLVNAGGTTTTTGVAHYDSGQSSESTRHYFTYTVGANDNTDRLNVTGISLDEGSTALPANTTDTAWQSTTYPFTFVYTAIDNSTEEVRLTMNPNHVTNDTSRNGVEITSTANPGVAGTPFFARLVPVNANSNTTANPDYIYTLAGGKDIRIDNNPPTITNITASPQGWHGVGVDLYITATFSDPVRLGTTLPRLTLSAGTNRQTISSTDDIRVNNNQITFRYRVLANDTTGTSELQVTGLTGTNSILDIPGNPMPLTPFTTRTLTGVYLDTAAPAVPTVTVHSGTPPTTTNQIGTSGNSAVNLNNLYDENLYIRVAGASGAQNLGRIEYSLNNGVDWTSSITATTDIQVKNSGVSQVLARQTDQAGNTSANSQVVRFNWDPGKLITRISSTSPNGTYTNVAGRNSINVTVTFRKSLTFTATTPAITINARSANVTTTRPSGSVSTLSFTYEVAIGDGASLLDVTNISGITANDGSGDVSRYLNGTLGSTLPAAGAGARLNENKRIEVVTGTLSNLNTTFIADSDGGTGWNTEANANYHGIRSDDGSYWTTLQIVFNRNINKGSGDIKIEQIAGTGNTAYRLPAVLTEAQYNRFKNVAALSSSIDTYYTKGTNGYINGQGSDTSAKYVLNYNNNPNSGRGGTAVFDGDVLPAGTFFADFREAEGISLSVNSQAVEVSGDTLKVRLSGSNAPQVPGATYRITYPGGLVTDILGNSSDAMDVQVALRGVAKPFVRIKKTQDTITRQEASMTTPTLTATQPLYAYVRMDSRTPSSSIVYWAAPYNYTTNTSNWNGSNVTAPATPGPVNPNTPAANRPNLTGTSTTYTPQLNQPNPNQYGIRIGADSYGGYKWYVVARASATVGGSAYTSDYSDEMAYRTAITYRLHGMRLLDTTGQQLITGDTATTFGGRQIWIRGGDSVGSSSIPGFPFTWEDNWSSLNANKKRAGIRLMTKTNNTDQLPDSTWQFMTWDINATAYVDFVLGLDDTQSVNNFNFTPSGSLQEVWQYGPKYWALQRAGWAPSKSLYPVYPGEIRYLDTGTNFPGAGDAAPAPQMNFSAAFNTRGAQTATITGANTN